MMNELNFQMLNHCAFILVFFYVLLFHHLHVQPMIQCFSKLTKLSCDDETLVRAQKALT